MRYFIVGFIVLLLVAASASAQDTPTPEELKRRVEELERTVAELKSSGTDSEDLDELKRRIEILASEIETLKVDRQKIATADAESHGLGKAASKVYRSEQGVSFGGYGETLYENFASDRDDGSPSGRTDQLDVLRAILYTGYKFNDKVLFNSELEVEHATTDDGIGEVALEFAYLDFLSRPELNVRAGLMLMPVGLINELHEPTAFLGAKRPEVERQIIPSTWREAGVGLFGDIGAVSYRTYLVTGLDSEEFGAGGIRSGRQGGAKAKAEDFAFVGRLDWQPVEGVLFGGSLYSGDSAQGEETPAGESFGGRVTLGELHADARIRGALLRGLWATGRISDADKINVTNSLAGQSGVGKNFGGWYVEGGYDLAALPGWRTSVTPFLRYESYDTQKDVPEGFSRNPALDIDTLTFGVSWKPIPEAVIKVDYQNVENEAGTGVDQFNVALGYIF